MTGRAVGDAVDAYARLVDAIVRDELAQLGRPHVVLVVSPVCESIEVVGPFATALAAAIGADELRRIDEAEFGPDQPNSYRVAPLLSPLCHPREP